MVPISGIVTWKSDSSSSRNASNSSSARSISSIRRTGGGSSALSIPSGNGGRPRKRRALVRVVDRVEQRAAHQEAAAEHVVYRVGLRRLGRLERADVEHLPRVVP